MVRISAVFAVVVDMSTVEWATAGSCSSLGVSDMNHCGDACPGDGWSASCCPLQCTCSSGGGCNDANPDSVAPAPAPGPSGGVSGSTGHLDQAYILREHNIARCIHGADPLTWDDSLASHGESWANTIHYSNMHHGDMDFDGKHVGQNLYGSCISPGTPHSDREAVDDWMKEESYQGGHYTQVIWKGSQQVGCGMWCGPDMGMTCCMVACDYYPAGNLVGAEGANVAGRVRSRADCEAQFPSFLTDIPKDAQQLPSQMTRILAVIGLATGMLISGLVVAVRMRNMHMKSNYVPLLDDNVQDPVK